MEDKLPPETIQIDFQNRYIQNEAWFEVSRYYPDLVAPGEVKDPDPRSHILIINSYGRLRKLYTEAGRYEDVSDGGPVK